MTTYLRTLNDIRHTFLDFFSKNDHKKQHSAPLVPHDDPTLLFVNAGMVPFKNRFIGLEKSSVNRVTSAQKCVRAGGKHNDLDNVGYTVRHHTFFEMLGNFSFGDYFKEDAIKFSWELLTKEFNINPDKLLVTVFHTDEEAVNLWKKIAGFSDHKIIRINSSDNFWSMGETGPCGPCSEIFYDHGAHIAGGPPGSPDEDGDRFIEIWNLVFMQYERHKDGTQTNLPAPCIDTGMGLERFAALMQGKHDNYQTDLMQSLIQYSSDLTKTDPDGKFAFSHRILADHLRASGFLIADGVLPSNDGRGYVLRRIMRRAMRHAHIIGAKEPLMHQLIPALIHTMGQDYPELVTAETIMKESLLQEEEAFRKTLSRGLSLLSDATHSVQNNILSGDIAFKLYDTYGFPLDLTQDILRGQNMRVNIDEFNAAMDVQKNMARSARDVTEQTDNDKIWITLGNQFNETEFTGYHEAVTKNAKILALVQDANTVDRIDQGFVELICDKTSFYAESGGQVGDTGFVIGDNFKIKITDCQKKAQKFHVMRGEIVSGICQVGDIVHTKIDIKRRKKIAANHSATHLLHQALRDVLGNSVTQKGSLVTAQRLRFDFSYTKPLTAEQIKAVEKNVNSIILQNKAITTEILTPEDARNKGALALFGEKYSDMVRVLFMGDDEHNHGKPFSIELCGGTHVNALGDIGACVIETEMGIANGIRRIEALTGQEALDYLNTKRDISAALAATLKTSDSQIIQRVNALLDDKKTAEKEISKLKQSLANSDADKVTIETINNIQFINQVVEGFNTKELMALIDSQKQKLGTGIIVYININDDKIGIAVGVTKDLTDRFNAVDYVQVASKILGGKGGGGRPDFAQAGGTDSTKIDEALAAIKDIIREKVI